MISRPKVDFGDVVEYHDSPILEQFVVFKHLKLYVYMTIEIMKIFIICTVKFFMNIIKFIFIFY